MIVTGAVIVSPPGTDWNAVPKNILEHCSNHVKMVLMATRAQRTERRTDGLSKERIVEAAIEILDAQGESALTFRALTARLATGSGAIYYHVANKNDLLAAAADDVIARVMTEVVTGADPSKTIRAIALGVFDAIDAHPWVGAQLSREPWQSTMLQIFESIGERLQALGVPGRAQFDSASALVNYILGLAGQYAAAARLLARDTDRSAFLATVAAGGRSATRRNTRSCIRWRRSCASTTTATNSWPVSTSSWPASQPSGIVSDRPARAGSPEGPGTGGRRARRTSAGPGWPPPPRPPGPGTGSRGR